MSQCYAQCHNVMYNSCHNVTMLVMMVVGAGRGSPGQAWGFCDAVSLLLREAAAAASIARPSSGLRHQTLLPS